MTLATYADLFRPSLKWPARLYDPGLILGGSLFVALAAMLLLLGWRILGKGRER